ncbi:hypothetical protein L6164_027300 [Bauhinia variegata]|uniref:Uncharacterized protein n=1 Tax=Bauhinia variegata TaxID=167791 RepID=A0ACB9LSR6_BAUVA|nr:hypothetical protein L6164_027300 [Bauhinia variegata]
MSTNRTENVGKPDNCLSEGCGDDNVALLERLQRWVGFLPSILPGDSWWSFSDEVEVKISAKPVNCMLRACQNVGTGCSCTNVGW